MEIVKRERRLNLIANLLIYAIYLFTAYWVTRLLIFLIPQVFTDQIYRSGLVEPEAVVTLTMRMAYGFLWFVVVALGLLTAFFALRMLRLIKQKQYFSQETAANLQRVGWVLAASMIADTILSAFIPTILSWNNAPFDPNVVGSIGNIAPRYYYDPGDITAFLCGISFFLIGWLLEEGRRIEAENKEFI